MANKVRITRTRTLPFIIRLLDGFSLLFLGALLLDTLFLDVLLVFLIKLDFLDVGWITSYASKVKCG